jgi:hypothetical protein
MTIVHPTAQKVFGIVSNGTYDGRIVNLDVFKDDMGALHTTVLTTEEKNILRDRLISVASQAMAMVARLECQ